MNFSLMVHAFGLVSRYSSPNQNWWFFFLMLSSRSCITFHFTIRTMIHLELSFWKVWDLCSVLLFACWCPVVLGLFVEKNILSHWVVSLFKANGLYFYGSISGGLYFVPLICASILSSITQSLDYSNFIASPKFR